MPSPTPLRLAPGVRVVPRGRDLLQVGLLAPRRTVVPRTAAAERVLGDLARGAAVLPDPRDPVLRALAGADLLVPDEVPPVPRVRVVGRLDRDDPLPGLEVDQDAEVVLMLADGEVVREELDPLVRHGTAHLVVRLLDGAAVIGPFVVPGTTACLRCLDAHLAEGDPEHGAVAGRYAGPGPAGADPALTSLALAWAARDLAAHARGETPSTWSRTWRLGPGAEPPESTTWSRHPLCGCTWAEDARLAGTMES